jgi:hypothetical protein
MLFLEFSMHLWQLYNLKFLRIQMVRMLDIVHGGLYHWKAERLFE